MSRTVEYADLIHAGPGTLAGRYLRTFWQPVLRAQDLPTGRAVPITMMGEQFTLYRGESGASHLVAFRCAHRGTQLNVGWVEGECIRCRYHGWKYDETGQCVEQPGEEASFGSRVRIRAYPTQEYVGLVFAYLGEGEPPPFRRYPDLDRPGVFVVDPPEVVPCNYWNRMDNDGFHLAWTHRFNATRMGKPRYLVVPDEEDFWETEYGYATTKTAQGKRSAPNHFYMPNVLHFHPEVRARGYETMDLSEDKFAFVLPVDDETFVAFDVTRTPFTGDDAEQYAEARRVQQEPEADSRWEFAREVLAGRKRIEDMPDSISFLNGNAIEDYATQVGQGRTADRTQEHLGRIDARVIFKRKLWLRELQALADGRPLKDWRIPDHPLYEQESVAAGAG